MTADPRIDPALEWLLGRISEANPPLSTALISGGRSNLTYRVTDPSGSSWILRRQPIGPRPARAHDLAREFGILTALANHSRIPVPTPIVLCDDPSILGVTFFVMTDVSGQVLREPSQTVLMGRKIRSIAARRAVETMAAIHSVDLDSAGLADLGPRDNYVTRQLRRWLTQVEETGDAEVLEMLGQQQILLLREVPESAEVTLVHGDYRFDNVIFDPLTGDVRAVIDWEIATLGDPLADFALFLAAWDEVTDERPSFGVPGPTRVAGFPTRQQAIDWYAGYRQRDLSSLSFYLAFAYWRLACVLHCVSHRYKTGTGGGAGADSLPADVAQHVKWLAEKSLAHLNRHSAPRG